MPGDRPRVSSVAPETVLRVRPTGGPSAPDAARIRAASRARLQEPQHDSHEGLSVAGYCVSIEHGDGSESDDDDLDRDDGGHGRLGR